MDHGKTHLGIRLRSALLSTIPVFSEFLIGGPIFFLSSVWAPGSPRSGLLNLASNQGLRREVWILAGAALLLGLLLGGLGYRLLLRLRAPERRNLTLPESTAQFGHHALAGAADSRPAEDILLANQKLLAAIFAAAHDGLCLIDMNDQRIVDCNRQAVRMFGSGGASRLIGRRISDFFKYSLLEEERQRILELIRSGRSWSRDMEFETLSGTAFWGNLAVNKLEFPGCELALGRIADITQRKQAEERLRQLSAHLNLALDSSRVGTWSWDMEQALLSWDENMHRLYGLEAGTFSGRFESFLNAIHPEDRPTVMQAINRSITEGVPFGNEYRVVWPDRSIHLIAAQGRVYHDGVGEPSRMIGVCMDVTELRRTQQSALHLATAVEQIEEAILITGPEGLVEYVNPAFERISGFAAAEVIGQNPRILRSERHDEAFYRELWATITAGRVWNGRMTNRKKEGALFEAELSISPVRDKAGGITHFIAVMRDITEKVNLEHQLQHSRKMEAIGRLAGGVAHDFNNLLTVILGYSDMALRDLAKDDPLCEEISEILRAAERAMDLTRQLLIFARKQAVAPAVIDLNQLILNTEKMLRRLIGEDIEIVTLLDARLDQVKVDPGQFEQLIINMAINARDAMPGGGKLTLETRNLAVEEPGRAPEPAGLAPGYWVMLAISDNGSGIPPEIQAKIFEPFFTTKERGRGTGLGLATAYGTVKQAGGSIFVYSEPGQGTTFKIYLPSTVESAGREAPGAGLSLMPRGAETILLVEDEPQVRRMAADILGSLGYCVLEAENGAEALNLVCGREESIHLLLTDVVMPQMGGRQLADRFRELASGVRILFTSGYTENAIMHHGVLDQGIDFIAKPFTPSGLALKVRQVLDA